MYRQKQINIVRYIFFNIKPSKGRRHPHFIKGSQNDPKMAAAPNLPESSNHLHPYMSKQVILWREYLCFKKGTNVLIKKLSEDLKKEDLLQEENKVITTAPLNSHEYTLCYKFPSTPPLNTLLHTFKFFQQHSKFERKKAEVLRAEFSKQPQLQEVIHLHPSPIYTFFISSYRGTTT